MIRAGLNSIVLIFFLFLMDIYVFQAIRVIMQLSAPKIRNITFAVYWLTTASSVILVIVLPFINWHNWPATLKSYLMAIFIGLVLAKLIIAVFLLSDDLRRGGLWLIQKFTTEKTDIVVTQAPDLSRSQFLSRLGMLTGGTFLAALVYGFTNKYNYRVHKIKLKFNHLPASFKGLRLIQISDIHAGSFANREAVKKGVELIKAQQADLVLFTGDLVNDRADEMYPWMDVFSQVKAPMGVYAILGNHDYGDYYPWPDRMPNGYSAMQHENLQRLQVLHAELGWKLMKNENVVLQRGDDHIALIGVENWSAIKRFPRYGDLKRAYESVEHIPFKILLSHDPTHWDAQVLTTYPDIALTLAGHTHGMQFGIEIPGFKWSPARFFYKEWAGLYKNREQFLYVNRGFGFLGYPGRVGILPEITVIDLV